MLEFVEIHSTMENKIRDRENVGKKGFKLDG